MDPEKTIKGTHRHVIKPTVDFVNRTEELEHLRNWPWAFIAIAGLLGMLVMAIIAVIVSKMG